MVDLAKEAFSTNNFGLAADIYERTIAENGPKSELFLGLADSFARGGHFLKAFNAYTNAYRYGRVVPEKLKHLVVGLIDYVKQDLSNSGAHDVKRSCMFTCGCCRGLLADPVTVPCGHTFCRKCLEKDKSKTCELCNISHYWLKVRSLHSNVVLTKLIDKLFPHERKAATLKKEANGYFEKRDFKKAIDVYTRAIQISSRDHLLFSNRCHAYNALDQFSEALQDANQVLHLRPDWPKGYFRKGTALYGLCKYEDASVAFLQCLALDQKVIPAKDYLSKALDKILSALPPDDPKAHALQQKRNPSLLQQLIDGNFSGQQLLPDITHTICDLAHIVKETISVANNFSEPKPDFNSDLSLGSAVELVKDDNAPAVTGNSSGHLSQKSRCSSLPDCSEVNSEIEQLTQPRSHSPLCTISRKRCRNSSSSALSPVSPTQSSPQKVFKPTLASSSTTNTNLTHIETTEGNCIKPELLCLEDLECGLCYRLFCEPVTTPCGHTFCRKCLDRCLDHTVTCPLCKGNLAEYLAERRHTVTDAIQCIMNTYFKDEYDKRCKINEEEMVELTRMGSGHQSDVPVFVCTLAFPTIACPLHIFEPRYRLMVRQCMESGTRQFGMCRQTSDNDDEFSDYGCMLEVRDVQYFPDGRSVVDTIGGRRFKVLSRGKREGYNTAKVEFIEDEAIDAEEMPGVIALQTEIYKMLNEWLGGLPSINRTRINTHFGELPPLDPTPSIGDNASTWAWWAMAVLPLDPRVQAALLAMSSYKERLIALKKVLVYMNRKRSR